MLHVFVDLIINQSAYTSFPNLLKSSFDKHKRSENEQLWAKTGFRRD
jgi:hypothetical protein